MDAQSLAQKIVAEFGTNDVYEIAGEAGVKIVYEDWYPVTIGEYEKRTKTIRVNRRALEQNKGDFENKRNLEKKIIAHELGHFFAIDLNFDKTQEEVFAREFAESLTKNIE
ncbi:MAG TPA: hypothetical protein VF556_13035 [Pyrinomonadaceae bacterium]|jgi:predicted SprT family Zn-dependent metalloprotease